MPHRRIQDSRAVVTGASSGIGHALALELARQHARVLIVARREDRLLRLAEQISADGGQVEVVVGDITDAATRQEVLETVRSRFGGLDILVNNAGIGALGRFEDADPQRLRRIMEVNFFALVEMTRLALPLLKEGAKPITVNIGSILGHRGTPLNSEYCASKFAVEGFSQALRAELARYPIDVLVVSPGTTTTEFFDNVIERTGEPSWPEHAPVTAAQVARRTVRAIRSGRHEIIPYGWGKVLCWLNRLSPRLMDYVMARYA